jgi:ATP synthase F1 gamma subunit
LDAYENDDHILKNLEEFTLANTLYWTISEGYASEMAAKRSAMENATKSAGEMIQKLTLTYNRSRQASITNELVCDFAFIFFIWLGSFFVMRMALINICFVVCVD